MSKNIFLVQYQDQNYFDDTSETIDEVYLNKFKLRNKYED